MSEMKMVGFQELSPIETQNVNGGGILLAALAIAGGIIVIFGGTFAIGYGLAQWLG